MTCDMSIDIWLDMAPDAKEVFLYSERKKGTICRKTNQFSKLNNTRKHPECSWHKENEAKAATRTAEKARHMAALHVVAAARDNLRPTRCSRTPKPHAMHGPLAYDRWHR